MAWLHSQGRVEVRKRLRPSCAPFGLAETSLRCSIVRDLPAIRRVPILRRVPKEVAVPFCSSQKMHVSRRGALAWLVAAAGAALLGIADSGGAGIDVGRSSVGISILGSVQRRSSRIAQRAADASSNGDSEWAEHLFQRAVYLSPSDPHVLSCAARQAWEDQGRFDRAETWLVQAMALDAQHPTVALEAARFMLAVSQDNGPRAEAVLRAALERRGGALLLGANLQREHLSLALADAVLAQRGRERDAEPLYRGVIAALGSAEDPGAFGRGDAATRAKLRAAARAGLAESAGLGPTPDGHAPEEGPPEGLDERALRTKTAALLERAAALQRVGEHAAEEVALLSRAVALAPASADAHAALGFAQQRAGDTSAAECSYDVALHLSPTHAVRLPRPSRCERARPRRSLI